ncbi:MAG: ATP-binding cassette domain-containing protein, partial [Phycisphaerales bacterium]|nr:ATP-binding cassette domain-containing protein [Phycisphaerales bacterium]
MTNTAAAPKSSSPSTQVEPLLDVRGLKTYFPIRTGLLQRVTDHFKAVDDVSFSIGKGETLGLVGESGCGKTTVGRTLLRLVPATAGTVTFEGHNMFTASGSELQKLRSDMQIVFQDPAGSLNPRMRVATIIGEPLLIHGMVTDKAELRERVESLLERCGMPRAAADRYPHEF